MAKLRSLVSLALLLVLAAGVSVYVLRSIWRGESPEPAGAAIEAPAPRATADIPERGTDKQEVIVPAAAEPAGADTIAQRFRAASDYLVFVRGIHAAARAGDPAAQYYLFRSLDYCHGLFRAYFGPPGARRTLDEGLQWAARNAPGLDVGEARRVDARCRTLEESDVAAFGEPEQWLQRAALGGQPDAQAVYAGKLLMTSHGLPADEAVRTRDDARDLVRAALAGGDPEIVFAVGNLGALRREGHASPNEDLAWMLAACQRGLDCSSGAERTQALCRMDSNCQPYESMIDMARRLVDDYPGVEARAREINQLIDAGDWDALGLGAASSP